MRCDLIELEIEKRKNWKIRILYTYCFISVSHRKINNIFHNHNHCESVLLWSNIVMHMWTRKLKRLWYLHLIHMRNSSLKQEFYIILQKYFEIWKSLYENKYKILKQLLDIFNHKFLQIFIIITLKYIQSKKRFNWSSRLNSIILCNSIKFLYSIYSI